VDVVVSIRPEQPEDFAGIQTVLTAAFFTDAEARLAEALRAAGGLTLSLVARVDSEVIAHVAFTNVSIDAQPLGLALAPLAVIPDHQRQGVGSQLMRAGLEQCVQRGFTRIFVLGDPKYYTRFDFVPAAPFGVRCPFDAPEEAFQVLNFAPTVPSSQRGLLRYHPAFQAFI
jgi:putative acetyltransferase